MGNIFVEESKRFNINQNFSKENPKFTGNTFVGISLSKNIYYYKNNLKKFFKKIFKDEEFTEIRNTTELLPKVKLSKEISLRDKLSEKGLL